MEPRDELMIKLGEIGSDVKTLLASSSSHEKRISSLERYRYTIAGFAAAVGMVVPAGIAKALGYF